ncbi:MAG: TadE/TadG family type IV pilus assembly protein [Firmicutes bacterium]|nr:TadE/TadG family type IV pilus assembly protein [Bacillota bacterium]
MKNFCQGVKRDSGGQALVETALVIPLLLLLLMGIIQFGLIFNTDFILTNASRAGARAAMLGKSDTEIETIVEGAVAGLDTAKLTVDTTPSEGSRSYGDPVTVEVRYQLDLIVPLFDGILTDPMHLKASTTMRME